MEERVTLLDVAEHAGVSRATASLVLRDAGRLSDSTRARVRASMRSLGYVYHRGAASLRTSATQTVGLVLPNPANAFWAELTLGIESVLAPEGLLVLTTNTFEDVDRQTVLVRALLELQVDGLIILPARGSGSQLVQQLTHANIPVVVTTRALKVPTATYVGIHNVRGGELAAQHLLWHGSKTFGYLGGLAGVGPRRDRLTGVRKALRGKDADLVVNLSGPATGEWGREAMNALIEDGATPEAVICHNDAVAFGVYRAVRDHAPDLLARLRVIGFDDVDEAALWEPPISSVAASGRDMGMQTASALLTRLTSRSETLARSLLQPELLVRQSCGCPASKRAVPAGKAE